MRRTDGCHGALSPGRIKAAVPVPVSHPRAWTTKTSPGFGALKAELTGLICEETRRAAMAGA